MNRRGVLKLLGVSPAAGPGVVSKLIDEVKRAEAQRAGQDLPAMAYPPYGPGSVPDEKMKLTLRLPWVQSMLRELIEEECMHVSSIDQDLAVLRSVSMAAKICYQRKRNIERRMKQFQFGSNYSRIENFLRGLRKA